MDKLDQIETVHWNTALSHRREACWNAYFSLTTNSLLYIEEVRKECLYKYQHYISVVNKAWKPSLKKKKILLMSVEVSNKALKMIHLREKNITIWNGLSCCLLIRCPWEIWVAYKSNNRSFHHFSMALLFRPSLPDCSRQPLAHLWAVHFFCLHHFI